MERKRAARCPLCHTVVPSRPDLKPNEPVSLRRHLARECTVRVA